MEKLRRKIPALLLAALLLGMAVCTAGAEALPSAELPPVRASVESSAEPSATPSMEPSAQPSIEPSPSVGAAIPLPVPADSGEEREPSLIERLFVPVAAAAVVLLGIVIWLAWARKRDRRRTGATPLPPARRDSVSVTMAPGVRPTYRVGNLHHIGQRKEQQDSFCLSDIGDEEATQQKGLLAVVADGMGGLEGGAAISQRVTDTFLARYRKLNVPDADKFLCDSVMASEKAVEELMAASGVNGGSTVVAVLLRGGALHFISVGDSRIYLLRRGELLQLNREHTYGALLRERAALGEIDPEEPYINPRRDALTAYIGMGSLKRIDRSEQPIPLQPGDKVLLCSDGVFNALGGDALRDTLAGDAVQAAARLEEAVLAQRLSNQDNFTGVVLEWEENK